MLFLALLATCFAASHAVVCFHGICDHIKKPATLSCEGGVIKNGGFCGCYDVCAKQEGEECTAKAIRGRPPIGTCDKGLKCVSQPHMVIGVGKCVKTAPKKARDTRTLCEQRRIASMISMVVYRGQWFPKCDAQGLFMSQQCDNTAMAEYGSIAKGEDGCRCQHASNKHIKAEYKVIYGCNEWLEDTYMCHYCSRKLDGPDK